MPVRTLTEFGRLHSCSPGHTWLFAPRHGSGIIFSGSGIHDNIPVTQAFCMAISTARCRKSARKFLPSHLLDQAFANRRWFDFDISYNTEGCTLYDGMIIFKEEFEIFAAAVDNHQLFLAGDNL